VFNIVFSKSNSQSVRKVGKDDDSIVDPMKDNGLLSERERTQ